MAYITGLTKNKKEWTPEFIVSIDAETCIGCGRCFKEPSPLEQLKLKGYRFDDVQSERWVLRSQAYLTSEAAVDDIKIELD